jgi:hypothetical protein
VPLLATDIAWASDKGAKFNNPTSWDNSVKPKNWQVAVQDLSVDTSNTGYENEDLIVWMRTAAFPSFRKLYRKVDHSASSFANNIPNGYYILLIKYSKFDDIMNQSCRKLEDEQ